MEHAIVRLLLTHLAMMVAVTVRKRSTNTRTWKRWSGWNTRRWTWTAGTERRSITAPTTRREAATERHSSTKTSRRSTRQWQTAIGADFHRAMVATAPGEKLLIGRRPMRNEELIVRYLACFCTENYISSWENQKKLVPPELHFLTPICTKSFVGWGFATDPIGGACSALPAPSVFRGSTSTGN